MIIAGPRGLLEHRYSADGTLFVELPVGGELSTNLSTAEGYDNVKQALIDASG